MLGELVGNFRVVSVLGQGGMGTVYLAEQVSIQTRVAIKVLFPHISAHKELVQRFFNEAVAVSRIKHAGIARIFDVGFAANGQAYLVMELLEGETLASRIRRSGRLSARSACEIGRQIANILEATHRAQIIHRDLKPDNVFLVGDAELESGERVKILDFGIAKLGSAGLTGTSGGSMGTPAYMAPEQWRSTKNVDWRADAYSLGCLAFEMATGRPPFVAQSVGDACTKHLTEAPPMLRSLAPEQPVALEQLVASLLEKVPDRRPDTMKAVTQAFARIGAALPGLLDSTIENDAMVDALAAPPTARPRQAQGAGVSTTLGGAASSGPASDSPMRRWRAPLLVAAAAAVVAVSLVALLRGQRTDDLAPATSSRVAAMPSEGSAARAPAPDPAPSPAAPPPSTTTSPGLPGASAGSDAPAAPSRSEAPAPQPATHDRPQDPDVRDPDTHRSGNRSGRSPTAARSPDTPSPRNSPPPAEPATPSPAPPPPSRALPDVSCDEVSCVLNHFAGACCAKFQKPPRVASGAAAPSVAAQNVPDSLDRAIISDGVAKVKAPILACGDRFPTKGQVKVSVKVAPDGHVTSVTVKNTPSPELGACVAARMETARFARTLNGGAFAYPYTF
ncbi:MAG TPA: protein kinase [Kofleriaceae bacterium]|nr:protein kinase [Kofleriaceae bacterium]